ncbi:MAG: GGDEF domain-containing protein [Acidobacteriota bacterium]|nr:GGDEF domain-containing protein [Acidobacteriota bacterium]
MQNELVRQQSFTDPLTEIYNRHSLNDVAGRLISQARRSKKALTILLIDVDKFKDVNTKFGHLTGDMVLADTASLLKISVRGSDAVFRYGGDEFLVILAETTAAESLHVINRIRMGVELWNSGKHLDDFMLTLSIGAAEWCDGQTLDELLDSADRDMYGEKAEQRSETAKPAQV